MKTIAGYRVVLLAAVVAATGCVEESELVGPYGEAYGEAGELAQPQLCDPDFGRTFVVDRLELMGFGEGYDLTGDGVPDNALAFLQSNANAGWKQSIASGAAIYLFDFLPYASEMSSMPVDPRMIFYHGEDTDSDPTNNVVGHAEFFVPAEQFDVTCAATSEFEDVAREGTEIISYTSSFSFFMEDFGILEFSDFRMNMDLTEDLSTLHGTAGGVWSYCSLSRSPFPGPTPGSFLDVMVNGIQQQADIDRDGDGLEVIVGDGDGVASCIDGDGTEIFGPSCVCDPRIVDGYSLALEGWGVPANIVGLVHTF